MKTKLITILLCLFPLLAYAQNYEQKGDELFAQAQYEQALKKYKAAEVSAEMNDQQASSTLKQKKEKAQKCATLLSKAKSAEENNQYSEAAKAYEDLFALHALAAYQKKSQTLKKSSSTQSYGTQTTATNTKQKSEGTVDIVIPYGVTEIKEREYYDRNDIKSVVIPNSVKSIGDKAFYHCTSLTSVTIPSSVTSIGEKAFEGCISLTSVTIGNSVIRIGDRAFNNCKGLTSVTIPNSVTSIGDLAFQYCKSLTSVTIPNSVTSIGYSAFEGCSSLISINVVADNPKYSSLDGVLFDKDKTTIIQYPGGRQGKYAIPNSVTSIGYSAFGGCGRLTSVTIPNSVTSIGYDAFSWCTSLTSMIIPQSVTSIGSAAFWKCKKLVIKLPDRFRGKIDVQNCKEVIYY